MRGSLPRQRVQQAYRQGRRGNPRSCVGSGNSVFRRGSLVWLWIVRASLLPFPAQSKARGLLTLLQSGKALQGFEEQQACRDLSVVRLPKRRRVRLYGGRCSPLDRRKPRVDCLDVAFVHDISPDFAFFPNGWEEQYKIASKGAFPALSKMRDEGIIQAWGIGGNKPL